MIRTCLPILFALTTLARAAETTTMPVDDPMKRLGDNVRAIAFRAVSTGISGLPGTPAADVKSMRPDGSWADQDYADRDRVAWKAGTHLSRLERIVRAAYGKGGEPDAATRERIVSALRFWLQADPQNDNWWWNEIGVPRSIGTILVMAGDDVPADVRDRGVALMRRANWAKQTGANLLDETWIQVLRGCVERSPTTVDEAFARTWRELRIVDPGEEGIQADGSFHQHGALLYNQSYGGVLLTATLRFLEAADGTAYRAPDASMDALATFTLDGDRWMRRGDVWDWSVCGRAFTRPGATKDRFATMLASLAKFDGGTRAADRRAAATQAADAPAPLGNRYFWRSEYLTHRRAGFFASIRMLSSRLVNTDILTNGENKLSHHIADGAMSVMLDGREYFDIYPVWDWQRIPGTTAEQGAPMPADAIRRTGGSDVAGGVCDGDLGCCAMTLAYDALRADKAWFCFDDQIVCLGAGIDCATDQEVVTSVNQCLLDGTASADGDPIATDRAVDATWAWHAGVGYRSLDPATKLSVRARTQRGAWSLIGVGQSTPIERDVFSVSVSHGTRPTGATYAYAVMPGAARERAAAPATVRVLANTPQLQAVANGAVMQAIFRAAGEVRDGGTTIGVDRPCAVMIRPRDGGIAVSVASLTNVAETIAVTMTRQGGSARVLRIALPAGRDAGRTATKNASN